MNLKKILCPIDYSELNGVANEYASFLAHSSGASIIYLHIFLRDPAVTAPPKFDTDQTLDRQVHRLQEFVKPTIESVPCEYFVVFDLAISGIVEFAKKNDVDMIVMPTRGRTGLGRLIMGSVAEGVVRNADCPVLALKPQNPEGALHNEGVVCAIDVRDFDQEVIDIAASFARSWGTKLDLVHVTLSPDPSRAAWPAYLGAPAELAQDHHLFQQIETTVEGVEVNRHHLSGLPEKSVVEFAEHQHPRILVLGTHGRKGISRVFGSIASRIMRKVDCPVLVVRQRKNHQSWSPLQISSDETTK